MKKTSAVLKPVPSSIPHIDYTLLIVVVCLALFGTVMIFSSSYYSQSIDVFYYLKRQIVWLCLGTTAMIFCIYFPYSYYKNLSFLLYITSIALLFAVILFGAEGKGSRRWLEIAGFRFQPSELVKLTIILHLSNIISQNKNLLKTTKGLVQCAIIVLIPVVIIAVSNFSTALTVAVIGFSVIFVASPKIWYFIVGGGLMVVGALPFLLIEKYAYRLERLVAWRDPFSDPTDSGFQTVQSLYAVASGGMFGLGLGQSRQKKGYIPEAFNDIIFAVICEELGFVGALFLIILYMILIWRGLKISMFSKSMFGTLVSFGIVVMVAFQALVNISVVTNTIPVTGMILPFISYGGTALLVTMSAMGILLNVSQDVH